MVSLRSVSAAILSCVLIPAALSGCNSDSTRPNADFHLEPDTLDFGEVYLGISDTLDFWIHNDAPRDLPLRLELDSAEFALLTGVGAAEFTLPRGRSLQILVVCSPLAPGPKGAVVFVEEEDSRFVTCLARAETHGCVVSPAHLDFGSVSVNGARELQYTISNPGATVLEGVTPMGTHLPAPWGIDIDCPFFVVDGGTPYSLEHGESLTVTVLFSPPTLKDFHCALRQGVIPGRDEIVCDEVVCSGRGVTGLPDGP